MRVNQTWIRHLFFTLAEHGFIRVLDALCSILLIRILGTVHFGMYASYQSWVAMLLIFLPYVELSLFRSYGQWKASHELYRIIAAYKLYNKIKLAVAFVVVAILSLYPQPDFYYVHFLLLSLALMMPLSQSLYGMDRDPLRFEKKQHVVTFVSAAQKLALIIGMVISFYAFPGRMVVLVPVSLIVFYIFGLVWKHYSSQVIVHENITLQEARPIITTSLKSTAIWLHFVQVVRDAVFTVDLFALSFGAIAIEEIGRYSIALKSANFFQMVPVAISSAFSVYLGKISAYQDRENFNKARRLTIILLISMLVMCSSIYFVGIELQRPILEFVGKHKLITDYDFIEAGALFRWRLASFMLYTAFLPVSSYLVAKINVKKYCLYLIFPWMIFSLGLFIWTSQYSALDTAKANMLSYAFHNIVLMGIYFYSARLRPQ